MSVADRRVRKVRLTGPDETLIRRGAILLEDAFRTASLPHAAAGRLLVFRSLALGAIRSSASSATIAVTIERRVWELAGSAVRAEDPAAPHRPVVWFRDETEPFIALAVRLAAQQPTDAWFWPLAVSAWKPALPRDEALRAVLFGVLDTRPGAAAGMRLLVELVERGLEGPLLSALRWQEGPALVQRFGWSPPPVGPPPADLEEAKGSGVRLALRRASVLETWGGRWGAQDARSLWLAAVLVAAERPIRLLDRQLVRRAQRVLERAIAQTTPVRPAVATEPTPRPGFEATLSAQDASAVVSPRGSLAVSGDAERGPAQPIDRNQGSEGRTAPPSPRESRLVTPRPHAGTEPMSDIIARASPESPGFEHHTEYASLLFVVPLLERLGIAPFLEAHPRLIEWDFPRRLLLHLAGRLRIAADDSVLAAIPRDSDEDVSPRRAGFTAPVVWRNSVCRGASWILRQLAGPDRVRSLADASGRLVVAVWQGRAPPVVRELVSGQRVGRAAPRVINSDEDVLLSSWTSAMRRWCRRFAAMGLRELVSKPGRLTVTRTHVDVAFDHRLIDIRVRKAGLDLDPGWVPWFGRVVHFHYLSDESGDAG